MEDLALGPNVKVVSWCSQPSVLAHPSVGAFLTQVTHLASRGLSLQAVLPIISLSRGSASELMATRSLPGLACSRIPLWLLS